MIAPVHNDSGHSSGRDGLLRNPKFRRSARLLGILLVTALVGFGLVQLKGLLFPTRIALGAIPFGQPPGTRVVIGKSLALPDPVQISGEEGALLEKALLLARTGESEQAIAILGDLAVTHDQDAALVHTYAEVVLGYTLASPDLLSSVEMLLDRHPKSSRFPALQLDRACFRERRGDLAGARLLLDKLIRTSPQAAEVRIALTRVLLTQANPIEALKQARWAVSLSEVALQGEGGGGSGGSATSTSDLRADAYAQLAAIQHVRGVLDTAAQACTYALSLFPLRKDLLLLQARLLEYDGDLDGAIRLYDRLDQIYPGDPEVVIARQSLGAKQKPTLGGASPAGAGSKAILAAIDELIVARPDDQELRALREKIAGLLAQMPAPASATSLSTSAPTTAATATPTAGTEAPATPGSATATASAVGAAPITTSPGLGHWKVNWNSTPELFFQQARKADFSPLAPGVWQTVIDTGGFREQVTVHFGPDGLGKIQVLLEEMEGRQIDMLGRTLRINSRIVGEPQATGETTCPGYKEFQGFIWETPDNFELMAQFTGRAQQVRLVRLAKKRLPVPFELCEVLPELLDFKP
jgi:tetratricopeptide (TPR) repeat protein